MKYAIQKPCHAPTRIPPMSMTITANTQLISLSIMTAPIPPMKQTTEPQARSILPPVKIQRSMPAARTNTYAFCEIRLFTFCARSILPPVIAWKKMITAKRANTIVYFLRTSLIFILMSFTPSRL